MCSIHSPCHHTHNVLSSGTRAFMPCPVGIRHSLVVQQHTTQQLPQAPQQRARVQLQIVHVGQYLAINACSAHCCFCLMQPALGLLIHPDIGALLLLTAEPPSSSSSNSSSHSDGVTGGSSLMESEGAFLLKLLAFSVVGQQHSVSDSSAHVLPSGWPQGCLCMSALRCCSQGLLCLQCCTCNKHLWCTILAQ